MNFIKIRLLLGICLLGGLSSPTAAQVIGVLKGGLLAGGGGDFDETCSGAATCKLKTTALEDKSGLTLGGDLLWETNNDIRWGIGALYNSDTKFSANGKTVTFGTDFAVHGVFEYLAPISAKATLVLRAQVGALVLLPGGEMKDTINKISDLCVGGVCTVDSGPYKGLSYGIGPSLLVGVQRIKLRFELLYQGFGLDLISVSGVVSKSGTGSSLEHYAGHRVLAMFGVELGGD